MYVYMDMKHIADAPKLAASGWLLPTNSGVQETALDWRLCRLVT